MKERDALGVVAKCMLQKRFLQRVEVGTESALSAVSAARP